MNSSTGVQLKFGQLGLTKKEAGVHMKKHMLLFDTSPGWLCTDVKNVTPRYKSFFYLFRIFYISYVTKLNNMKLNRKQIELLNNYTEGEWTINEKTGLVDIEGDFDCRDNGRLISFKGVKFGVVTGRFDCVGNRIISLEGAPQKVGSFWCDGNNLTSLEGAPQEVEGIFSCDYNNLTSLEGAPQEVEGIFSCRGNKLTNLVGAPHEVKGSFDCGNNKLTSLEGAPQEVGGSFRCHNNSLTSLVGAPQEVGGSFDCSGNRLTSLVGAPQKVGGSFSCCDNPISEKTLKLVWETIQKNKIDYWTALCILNSQIPNGYWKKMSIGLDGRLSKDAQKGYLTLDQFGLFG